MVRIDHTPGSGGVEHGRALRHAGRETVPADNQRRPLRHDARAGRHGTLMLGPGDVAATAKKERVNVASRLTVVTAPATTSATMMNVSPVRAAKSTET